MIISCSSKKSIVQQIIGKKYTAKTLNRELIIEVKNDKTLTITNIFNCSNLTENYKKVSFQKEYKVIKNKKIVIKDSIISFNIPFIKNTDCEFLTEEYRKHKNIRVFDGRLITKNKIGLYTIPNIDTLKITESKLVYYKKTKKGSKGFIFEQQN